MSLFPFAPFLLAESAIQSMDSSLSCLTFVAAGIALVVVIGLLDVARHLARLRRIGLAMLEEQQKANKDMLTFLKYLSDRAKTAEEKRTAMAEEQTKALQWMIDNWPEGEQARESRE